MKFVKLTSNYYLDPAVAAQLTDASEVAFTRSIAYCGNAESGGFVAEAVLPSLMRKYTPARGRKVAAELVAARLWVEVPGGWRLRTWDRQQDELEKLLARRRSDAERQQRRRAKPPPDGDRSRDSSRDVSRDMNRDASRDPFRTRAVARPEIDQKKNALATLVCRRLSGDARVATTTDDERAELWAMWSDVAGPDVDLETELRTWLMRNAETDLRDPAGALLGWLRLARQRAAADTLTTPGCGACDRGWLGLDDDLRPRPCPTCRPHLRPVEAS